MERKYFNKLVSLLFFCGLVAHARSQPQDIETIASPSEEPIKLAQAEQKLKLAGVPAGFQFLLEKQTTAVDIFYGDVYVTTTLATYSPSTVEFHNPEEIVKRLDNLLTPEQIASSLMGELDSHVGEICYRSTDADCGKITPDEVGVIFDETRFRADIFINPNLLSVQQVSYNRYLPHSTSDFSSINNLALSYAGGGDSENQLALSGQSLFSVRQQRVISNWGIDDNNDGGPFYINTLYWQMDEKDHQYQAGWFTSETRFLTFIPTINLLGARYSTSLKARTDLEYAAGTKIELFLPTRSRVQIFKDDRYLTSAFYQPGNQILDTSKFPDGAYEVKIIITDSAGEDTTITRYFVKTPKLAPVDQDLYFIEVGDIQVFNSTTQVPESLKVPIVQGGYSLRLTDTIGLNFGGSLTQDELVSESGLVFINNWVDLDQRVLFSANGDYGFSFTGFARYYDLSASFQLRQIWNGSSRDDSEFQILPVESKQYDFSLSHPVLEGLAKFKYSLNQRKGQDSDEAISLSYHKYFQVNFMPGRYNFRAEVTKGSEDSLFMLHLDWGWNENNINHAVNLQARKEDNDQDGSNSFIRAGYRGGWNDGELRPEEYNVNWQVEVDDEDTLIGAEAIAQGYLGATKLAVDYHDTTSGSNLLYSGVTSTSFAGEKKVWGVGGKQSGQGAIIIQVQGDSSKKEKYDVYINKLLYGEITSGQKVVIPVAAYHEYDISLKDKGTSFVSFDHDVQSVAIYPGNVKVLKWNASTIAVLVARILRRVPGCFDDNEESCWDPLIHARAKGVNDFGATDTDGYIQTEVFPSSGSFILSKKSGSCKVDISGIDFSDGFAYAEEDLKCIDIEEEAQPLFR